MRPAVVRGRVSVVAILLLLMARPSLTFAQSVTAAVAGIVVDVRTRQPLPGVLVELSRPPHWGAGRVTVTPGRRRPPWPARRSPLRPGSTSGGPPFST